MSFVHICTTVLYCLMNETELSGWRAQKYKDKDFCQCFSKMVQKYLFWVWGLPLSCVDLICSLFIPWNKACQLARNRSEATKNTWTCYYGFTVYLYFLFHRTQDTECRANRALVGQGETVPGLLCYEEWRPKLVRGKHIYQLAQLFLSFTKGQPQWFIRNRPISACCKRLLLLD